MARTSTARKKNVEVVFIPTLQSPHAVELDDFLNNSIIKLGFERLKPFSHNPNKMTIVSFFCKKPDSLNRSQKDLVSFFSGLGYKEYKYMHTMVNPQNKNLIVKIRPFSLAGSLSLEIYDFFDTEPEMKYFA